MAGVVDLLRCAIASSLVTGCIKIPPFEGPSDGLVDPIDAPSRMDAPTACEQGAPLHHYREGNQREVVCGPNHTMRFSNEGAHFPYSWRVGDHELISPSSLGACNEAGVGLGAYPSNLINGVGPELGVDPVYELDGPAVIKVAIGWTQSLTCSAPIQGRTTYSFFPDGRVSRYDRMTAGGDLIANASCSCGANPWRMTSYLVVPRAGLRFGGTPTPNIPGDGQQTDLTTNGNGQTFLCAETDDWAVSMGWRAFPGRIRGVGPDAIAIVHDMVDEMGNLPDETLPASWVGQTSQTMLVQQSDSEPACDQDRLLEHTDRSQTFRFDVFPSGQVVSPAVSIANDGIYGGERDTPGVPTPLVVPSGQTRAVLAAAVGGGIPRGFVVWLRFADGGTTFAVLRHGTTLVQGTDYLLQRNTGTDLPAAGASLQIWFRDALPQGQAIEIERS